MSEHEPSEKIIRRLRDMDEIPEPIEMTEAQLDEFAQATKRRRAKYIAPPPPDKDERLEEIRKLAPEFSRNSLMGGMIIDLLEFYDIAANHLELSQNVRARQAYNIERLEESRNALRRNNRALESALAAARAVIAAFVYPHAPMTPAQREAWEAWEKLNDKETETK